MERPASKDAAAWSVVKDLTQGSIAGHLISMSLVILLGMMGQILYLLVDLYFVSHLGPHAVAGVGVAGNLVFLEVALAQILAVGTTALVSHATGRKDQADANFVFNQSLVMAAICGAFTILAGVVFAKPFMQVMGADEGSRAAGVTFLYCFLPGLGLQYIAISMFAALRATGLVKPVMTVQLCAILLNAALAPVLIAGWGTGRPLGVAGAGFASTLAGVFSVSTLAWFLSQRGQYVSFHSTQWKPHFASWRRILKIGLPSGGEILVMFLLLGLMYWLIRGFGSEAQAGYGIGSRVMASVFLPAMSVAAAISPIVGQNFGARRADRVRNTFKLAASTEVALMTLIVPICHIAPDSMIGFFSTDPKVIETGAEYLRIVSWGFIFSGFVFSCTGMFQGLGNTWPGLFIAFANLLMFAIPAIYMSRQPGFELHQLWVLSVATVGVQAVLSFCLVHAQMNKRLAAFQPRLPLTSSSA